MVFPLMSVPVKSGAGLPISMANAEVIKASAANKAKDCFIIQFSLVDDIQNKRRNSRVFGSKNLCRSRGDEAQTRKPELIRVYLRRLLVSFFTVKRIKDD